MFSVFSSVVTDVKWPSGNLSVISTDQNLTLECLEVDTQNSILLFDTKGRLRGVYEATREDVDRLMIELDILIRYA